MKTAVVFYTRFGHTRALADELARQLGAELREIKGTREHGYPAMALGAIFNMHFRIEPMDLDFSTFDLVVLCTPIWAGKPACPTRTFLRDAHLEGRRVAVALSTAGHELAMAPQSIERALARQGARVEYATHTVMQDVPEEELRAAGRRIAGDLRSRLAEAGWALGPEGMAPGARREDARGPAPRFH